MTQPEDRSTFPRRDVKRVRAELNGLLEEAKSAYRRRHVRRAVELLYCAQSLANQHSLYSEATRVQQALGILSTGHKPRLFAREGGLEES